jgi:hypothetical protein
MRSEASEIKLRTSTATARPRRPELSHRQHDDEPSAIDEAFAALCDQPMRVDERVRAADSDEIIRQNQQLVANLVTQLEALDRQRSRLAQLLDGVESGQAT